MQSVPISASTLDMLEDLEADEIFLRENSQQNNSTGGDCYRAAGQYMMDNCISSKDCNLILVHGEVAGQGSLDGMTFGHAWIVDKEMVIDRSNGRNIQLPQPIYYALGHINDIGNIHEYSWAEAHQYMMTYEHWGPWELETESGL